MMEAAREVYVLADHSKLMQVAAARIAPLEAAHLLITDRRARPEDLEPLQAKGLRVELA